jgi:uncharacterized protein
LKIGVISDTHGNVDAWKQAQQVFSDVDLIIHAGDVLYHPPRLGYLPGYDIPAFAELLNASSVPIVIAQGNCDSQVYEELLEMPVQSPYALVHDQDLRIVVNHGHLLTQQQVIEAAKRYRAGVFISGHTHVPLLECAGGVVLMNPGSPAMPKFERHGKPAPTVGLIENGKARIVATEDQSVLFEVSL